METTETPAKPATMLVRLKPFNPKRGFVLRRYSYRGAQFHGDRGWYRVSAALAAELKELTQTGLPEDPPAFDVCTEDAAQAIDARESDAAEVRKSALKSNVVTSADLRDSNAVTAAVPDEPRRGARRVG